MSVVRYELPCDCKVGEFCNKCLAFRATRKQQRRAAMVQARLERANSEPTQAKRIEVSQPAKPKKAQDPDWTPPDVCKYAGPFLGKLDCGCAGSRKVFRCEHPDMQGAACVWAHGKPTPLPLVREDRTRVTLTDETLKCCCVCAQRQAPA